MDLKKNSQKDVSYTGWKRWKPTADEWEKLYEDGSVPEYLNLKENEYLIVESDGEIAITYCYEHGKLRKFTGQAIKISTSESSENSVNEKNDKTKKTQKYSKGKNVNIVPRNIEQSCAVDLLKDRNKTVKLITGGWGVGKTMLLSTAALEALKNGEFEKIIWIRNNVDVKDTKDLGALPGEIIDKLLPYLVPFIDHAGENAVRTMIEKESLVVEPLQSLRGRNFSNAIIMCSEAENLTKEHIQLIIARAAEGSEVWFDADNRQRDKVVFEKSKGVETMIEKFTGQELFGYVHLIKSERSKTAAMADLLDDN